MLVLRLKCEFCDKDLPASCKGALIFSCMCTFCADCADCASRCYKVIAPTGWGGSRFCERPGQPKKAPRESVSLEFQAAFAKRVVTKAEQDEISNFPSSYKSIEPARKQLTNR